MIKYTKEHEWLDFATNPIRVGVSKHAASSLGDVVFVELPDIATKVDVGDTVAVVESVKAASDIYAPLAGVIKETNENLVDNPQLINEDAINKGWIFSIEADGEIDESAFLSKEEYNNFIKDN